MNANGGGCDGGKDGFHNKELDGVVTEGEGGARGGEEGGEKAGIRGGAGVGLAAEERMGDEALDAVKGRLGDLGRCGGEGGDQRVEDGLGFSEGEADDGTGEGGGGGRGGDRRYSGGGGRGGELVDQGLALVRELGVAFAPRGILDDLIEGRKEDLSEKRVGFWRSRH